MNQTLLLTHMPVEKRQYPVARLVQPARRSMVRRPQAKVKVGCLSHAPHEVMGMADIANARRRLDFYSRWHGLTSPSLQIWKAS